MTKHHAAIQLLRLGALTAVQFVVYTGWRRSTAYRVLQDLAEVGRIKTARDGNRRVYFV